MAMNLQDAKSYILTAYGSNKNLKRAGEELQKALRQLNSSDSAKLREWYRTI